MTQNPPIKTDDVPAPSLSDFETALENVYAAARQLSKIDEAIPAQGDEAGWRRVFKRLNVTMSLLEAVRYRVELRLIA